MFDQVLRIKPPSAQNLLVAADGMGRTWTVSRLLSLHWDKTEDLDLQSTQRPKSSKPKRQRSAAAGLSSYDSLSIPDEQDRQDRWPNCV